MDTGPRLRAFLVAVAMTTTGVHAASPAFEAVRKVADTVGTPSAQFILGQMYEHGQGTEADPAKALHYYRLAAEQGYAKAQYRLGLAYLEGLPGLPPDPGQGHRWLARAAAQGHVEAQYRLGRALIDDGQAQEGAQWLITAAAGGHREAQYHTARLFLRGAGVPPDPIEAQRWMEEAAAQGHLPAARELAELLLSGAAGPPRPDQALRWLRWAAERGDAEAALVIARLYDGNDGLPADPAKALTWYRRAAQAGVRAAYAPLVRHLLAQGRGAEAEPWLERLARGGDANAALTLARLRLDLRHGAPGVAADPARAVWWLTRAAEGHDAQAAYVLGRLYLEGRGVTRNARLARRWLEAARAGGERRAILHRLLGRLYLYGQGGERDEARGLELLRQAAADGDADAAFLLAEFHAARTGDADLEAAERWYRRAAELGHAGAQERLGLSFAPE